MSTYNSVNKHVKKQVNSTPSKHLIGTKYKFRQMSRLTKDHKSCYYKYFQGHKGKHVHNDKHRWQILVEKKEV